MIYTPVLIVGYDNKAKNKVYTCGEAYTETDALDLVKEQAEWFFEQVCGNYHIVRVVDQLTASTTAKDLLECLQNIILEGPIETQEETQDNDTLVWITFNLVAHEMPQMPTVYCSSIGYNDQRNYQQVATVGPAYTEKEAFKQVCEFIASVENDQVFDERFSRQVLEIAETGDSSKLQSIIDEHEPISCQSFVWNTTKLQLKRKASCTEEDSEEEGNEEQEVIELPLVKKRQIDVVDLTNE